MNMVITKLHYEVVFLHLLTNFICIESIKFLSQQGLPVYIFFFIKKTQNNKIDQQICKGRLLCKGMKYNCESLHKISKMRIMNKEKSYIWSSLITYDLMEKLTKIFFTIQSF